MTIVKVLLTKILRILDRTSFILILVLVSILFKLFIDLQQQVITTKKPITTLDSIVIAMSKLKCPPDYIEPYALVINSNCNHFKVDWKWIVAKMRCESNFDPSLKSFVATKLKGDKEREYAVGLMQLKPSAAKEAANELGDVYSYEKLFDGITSIKWATYYFSKKLIRYYYNYERAVRAYNMGDQGIKDSIELSDNHWNKVLTVYHLIGE